MTYPVFGYQITLDEDAAVEVTIAGVTEDVTISAGTYWGWPALVSVLSGTLANAFVVGLISHSGWTTAPSIASASVGFTSHPTYGVDVASWTATFTGVTSTDTVTIDGSDSTKFDNAIGLTQGVAYTVGADGYLRSDRRWDGVWSPNVRGERIEPVYVDIGSQALSPYDASAHDRVRLGRRLLWFCDLPYVEAADVSREIDALSSGYAALAGRSAGDDRGTLDDLLGAAGSDSEIRLALVSTADETHQCVLDAAQDIQRDAFTSEETVGGRRYRVALPLIQASTYTGVDT
jgi:hypothetical protein